MKYLIGGFVMKCFNHSEKEAIAICKNCNKGLCRECAVEVDNGIACKDKCEEEVIFLNQMLQKNKGIYNKTAQSLYTACFIYLAMGVVFSGFGFYTEIPPLKPFLFIMGGIMILAGVLTAISGKKFKK